MYDFISPYESLASSRKQKPNGVCLSQNQIFHQKRESYSRRIVFHAFSMLGGIVCIPPELQYVRIIATTIKDGTDRNVQSDDTDDGLASTITVLVSPEQARLLAELEQDGTLHAALVYRGDSETAQMFLDAQAAVLEELYADEPEETENDGENAEDGEAQPENPDAETPPADSDTEGGEAE